jgi:hypothetical protein
MEHEKRLKAGEKMPFKKVIYCNIGNPQSLEQKPITFHRQVLSLVDYPELLSNKAALSAYPDDAVARAKAYLAAIPGGHSRRHWRVQRVARRCCSPSRSCELHWRTRWLCGVGVKCLFDGWCVTRGPNVDPLLDSQREGHDHDSHPTSAAQSPCCAVVFTVLMVGALRTVPAVLRVNHVVRRFTSRLLP